MAGGDGKVVFNGYKPLITLGEGNNNWFLSGKFKNLSAQAWLKRRRPVAVGNGVRKCVVVLDLWTRIFSSVSGKSA